MDRAYNVRNLVNMLNTYRDAYYNRNESLVSDREYDELFDRLVGLEKRTGIVFSDSPTVNVGYTAVSKLNKVKHNHPLLSLGKTTDYDEFISYFGDNKFCIMAKMDGLTASLRYVDGELVSAESRGNGEIGEDITNNVKVFSNVPLKIPHKGEVIVDGECIIGKQTFKEINEREHTQYKNPRNLVSGTVRQLDSKIVASRNVHFIAWKLYKCDGIIGNSGSWKNSLSASFGFLDNAGFEVVPYLVVNPKDFDEDSLKKVCENCKNTLVEHCEDWHYPIDGLVGAFDDVAFGNSLGSTSHHPKHSLAFKFYQERNETALLDIEWNTSRTGLVNPVAILDPVDIDGTTVARASLSNVSIIKELQLGIGDTVTVIKANQIIPMITDNLTRSNTYKLPTVCPCCGKPVTIKSDTGREMMYCTNALCPAILHDRISNFASRDGMNIVGISEERLRSLMDNGFITDFASLYRLKNHRDEIAKLNGFGKASADNIIKAIEESRGCKFANVLVAIGIPGIGKSTAKTIANHCCAHKNGGSIFETFINLAKDEYDWSILENFGKSMSDSINRYVCDNLDDILPLIPILNIQEDSAQEQQVNLFGGKSFCVTGKLLHYENRDALVADIEKYGGKIVSSVSAKTNYLITNDTSSGSSKNQKAAKFGAPIISEEDFIKMCKK